MKLYILIENFNGASVHEIEILPNPQNDGYIRFGKYNLQDLVPSKLYNDLVKNGLFEGKTTGTNGYNSPCGVHRLVMCLYDNCMNNKVHHIDKNRSNNNICNIINGSTIWHKGLHGTMSNKEAKAEAINKQNKLKSKLFRKKRTTLSNNKKLIQEIFRLRAKE